MVRAGRNRPAPVVVLSRDPAIPRLGRALGVLHDDDRRVRSEVVLGIRRLTDGSFPLSRLASCISRMLGPPALRLRRPRERSEFYVVGATPISDPFRSGGRSASAREMFVTTSDDPSAARSAPSKRGRLPKARHLPSMSSVTPKHWPTCEADAACARGDIVRGIASVRVLRP